MGGGMIGPDGKDGLSKHPPAWGQWPGRGRRGRHALSEGRPGGRQPASSRPFATAEPYLILRIMDNYVITHEMMIQGGQ